MSETLFIRLGSQVHERVHWLIWADNHNEIIASGELSNSDQLTELHEKSLSREVFVFVPACDVALKSLSVPAKSQRAIRLAAPYMLEDELAQDVEELFFAYANINNDDLNHNCFVAAVAKSQLKLWLSWLKDADIICKKMLPDVLAMPLVEQAYSAIALGEQILVRQGNWQGMTIDQSVWPIISKQWQQTDEQSENKSEVHSEGNGESNSEETVNKDKLTVTINSYSNLPLISDSLNINAQPEELPLALLAQHSSKQPFNLLQGEYLVKETRSPVLKNWLWVAGIALFALCLNLGIKSSQLWQLNDQLAAIDEQIITTYKKAFPATKRVRVATIKSQLKRKMAEVGSASGGDQFLVMLTKLQTAFASVPTLKPQSLKFDAKRQELRIQAIGNDYQDFEKFTEAVEKVELSVSQGAQNSQDDKISGSFSIANKKGQS